MVGRDSPAGKLARIKDFPVLLRREKSGPPDSLLTHDHGALRLRGPTFRGPKVAWLGQAVSLVRHIVTGTLQRRSAPLVVDLRRGDVAMAKQILHLRNIDTEVE